MIKKGATEMKQIEISFRASANELDKLSTRLERAEKALAKKRAAAEKAGVAEWTADDRRAYMETVPTTENGWILDKEAGKKNGAWFDLYSAKRDVEEINGKIERAVKRFEKVEEKVQQYRAEVEAINDLKKKEELFKKEFEEEQKEWAKDGIVLNDRYDGITPSGKRFSIYGNSGMTMRSRHCFTLTIEGKGVVFTSGEFWRAYGIIKKS